VASDELLLETLRRLAGDEGAGKKCLFQELKQVGSDISICGWHRTFSEQPLLFCGRNIWGKTSFFRTILLEVMVILSNDGIFQSIFIISIALWRDLELFAHSVTIVFSGLLKVWRVQRLPKPLFSQKHLMRPMRMINKLLKELHRLYHQRDMFRQFFDRMAAIPQMVSVFFVFPVTLLAVDHLDLLSGRVGNLDLMKPMIDAIGRVQSILSADDSEVIIPLHNDWNMISITDTCKSSFWDRQLIVSFK
jgi:hypothetical protein